MEITLSSAKIYNSFTHIIDSLRMHDNFDCKLFHVFDRVATVKELQQMNLALNVS